MSAPPATRDLQTLRRFIRAVTHLLTSEVRHKAILLLIFLLAFALSVNGLNVVNSYVGRDFMTAISSRDRAGFVRQAALYVGVFAASTAGGPVPIHRGAARAFLASMDDAADHSSIPCGSDLSSAQGVGHGR